jgi:hypothetical protein
MYDFIDASREYRQEGIENTAWILIPAKATVSFELLKILMN